MTDLATQRRRDRVKLQHRFPPKQRVTLSPAGKVALHTRGDDRIGSVIGYSWDGRSVRVHWDSASTAQTLDPQYLRKVRK